MIDEETIRRIYDFRAEGWPIKVIAREAGVARNTVKRYLRLAEQQENEPEQVDLRQGLEKGYSGAPRRRRGDAKSIHGQLLERGEVVPYSRVARKLRKELIEASDLAESLPGQRAEVNWGRIPLVQTLQGRRTLRIFTMQLSWSNEIYIEMSPTRSAGVFAQCHINAFNHFGGIPRRCVYPRECRMALEWDADGKPKWSPGIKLIASWTGFQPDSWLPYFQTVQCRLPKPIKRVQEMLTRAPTVKGLAELNLWVNNNFHNSDISGSMDSTGPALDHPTEQEREYLQELPNRNSLTIKTTAFVERDGTVQFTNRRWLVSIARIFDPVRLLGSGRMIQIWPALPGQDELLCDFCLERRPDLVEPEGYDDMCLFGLSEIDPQSVGSFIDLLLHRPMGNSVYQLRYGSHLDSIRVKKVMESGKDSGQKSSSWEDAAGEKYINLDHWVQLDPIGWLSNNYGRG